MKRGIGIYKGKTMDIGKILSGRPSSCPSLVKGSTLSLTMVLVAALSLIGCPGKPGTGTLNNDSRTIEQAGLTTKSLPMEEAGLTNASRSMEELGRRVIQGLNHEDREALAALAMTKEEYRLYIFPGLAIGKVEQWQKAYDFVWGTVYDRSHYRLTSILQKYGKRQLEYIGMRVADTEPWHLDCIIHKKALITIKDASGTEHEVEIFAGIAEVNNRFKIISFDVETL
jgi:hypothetical protein